jgi:glycosyltransferase involved in cell wall biosynthesis
MKITCLCPTYGRRQELLNNCLACFADQDYPDATLVLHDDLGTLANTKIDCPNVVIMSTTKRSSSVAQKFNEIVNYMGQDVGDALVVWDDDDIYLPRYISAHAEILRHNHWSKPSRIISAYHSPPQEEDATGRFHGSIALTTQYLWAVGGWIDTTRGTYDQEMLHLLGQAKQPGDPLQFAPPQYIYRWQTSQSGHCSGLMNHEDWYERYKPDSYEPIDKLWPEYSPGAIRDMQGVQAEPLRYLPSNESNLS